MSMADTSTGSTSTQGPPDWFVKPCKWLWKKQGFIWGTIGLSIVLNILASLFFIQWPWATNKNLDGTLIKWFIQNPVILLIAGLFLLLLFCIIYLGSRFKDPNKKSTEVVVNPEKDLQRNGIGNTLPRPDNEVVVNPEKDIQR